MRPCSDTTYNDDAAHLWRPTVGGHFAFSDGLESLADDLAGVDNGQSPPGAGNPGSSPACRRVSATMIMVRGSPVYTPVASCWVAVRPSVSVTKCRMGSGLEVMTVSPKVGTSSQVGAPSARKPPGTTIL